METAYSILMFIFGGVLFLYGLLCYKKKDYHLLPYRGRTAPKGWNTKAHVEKVGKIVMMIAAAPILSAIAGLIWPETIVPFIVLIVAFVALIWVGVKKIYYKDEK